MRLQHRGEVVGEGVIVVAVAWIAGAAMAAAVIGEASQPGLK
jgi:hypothetical protein